ncbi:MAG: thiamine phosphate synthase, partial [bacterium]
SKSGKVFLVSSDVALALQEGANGAHLTSEQDLGPACRMRKEAGKESFLLGKSVHSVSEVILAESQGADYVLLAPIFPPISKGSYNQALGVEVLREAADSVSIPVLALGGISWENSSQAVLSGAFGVAGISFVVDDIRRILNRGQ